MKTKKKTLILICSSSLIILSICLASSLYFDWLPFKKTFFKGSVATITSQSMQIFENVQFEKKILTKTKSEITKSKYIALKQQHSKYKSERTQKDLEWLSAMKSCHGIHGLHTKKKVIALTFDDGPNGKYTEDILTILAKHNIKATFFLIGDNALHYPALVKEELVAHHVIGNHSYYHSNFSTLENAYIIDELTKTNAIIYKLAGVMPHLFRPPFGVCSTRSAALTKQLGFKTIIWTDITNDYEISQTTSENIAKDIIKSIHPGGIIVLHDGGGDRTKTVAALITIIDALEKKGYQFLTVPELIHVSPYQFAIKDIPVKKDLRSTKNANTNLKNRHITTIVLYSGNIYQKSRNKLDLDSTKNGNTDEAKNELLKSNAIKSIFSPSCESSNCKIDEINDDTYNLAMIIKRHLTSNFIPHYIITCKGRIYRLLPDDVITEHANKTQLLRELKNINDFSIGIELIINNKDNKPTEAQYTALTELVKTLKSIYKINYVIDYNQITKNHSIAAWNFDWEKFNDQQKKRSKIISFL